MYAEDWRMKPSSTQCMSYTAHRPGESGLKHLTIIWPAGEVLDYQIFEEL